MLGCEPILDTRDAEARCLDDLPQIPVLGIGRTDRPAAAVQVQVDTPRLAFGREDTQRYLPVPAVRQERTRLGQTRLRREQPAPGVAYRSGLLDRNRMNRWSRCEQPLELLVEGPRLGDHGVGRDQTRI